MLLKNPNPDLLPVYQDNEFLPSISGWTIFGGVFLVSTVGMAFLVSAITPLPVTVKAPAMVRPSGEIKLVQAPTEGTVIQIDVKENQTILQGKPLVTLDSSRLSTRQSQLQVNLKKNSQQLQQILEQYGQRDINKTIVTAPISGIVLKLNLRNNNQTVRMGEEIAQIAPSNTPLVIKAKVSTQDIGKVKIGQFSQMRVSAYPYPDYGVLRGMVKEISPDAITPQNWVTNSVNSPKLSNNNSLPYYEVTIQPEQLYLKDDPQNSLQAGMEIQADMIYKNETVLKFILRKARLLTDL